jgi:asparagine synthase (glutamine-hydrolysing)
MCGINGIILRQKDASIETTINAMNNEIAHRGPDDDGAYIFQGIIGMGMRRLSIIDLANGKQPIYSDDQTIVIVFNGEIYNFVALKEELRLKGVHFLTNSDTEVILKLYEVYGTESFEKLNGMFAFSIHDRNLGKVFIVRDRFGEKPLHYYKNQSGFYWASELKSIKKVVPEIKKNISAEALSLYFSLSYIPAPYTIYEDVRKLQPGHFLTIDIADQSFSEKLYWDISKSNVIIDNYQEAINEVRKLMFDAVAKQMIADVPIGVFLSGGIDSTIIAAVMAKLAPDKKIKTFSIGFDNALYDETDRAKKVATHIGSEHHEFKLSGDVITKHINEVVVNFDEPFADSSSLPTYLVAKETAKYVKVALTGDGGDEVFGGYNKYLLMTYGNIYSKFIPDIINDNIVKPLSRYFFGKAKNTKSSKFKINRFVQATSTSWTERHLSIISLSFNEKEKKKLLVGKSYPSITTILQPHITKAIILFDDLLKAVRYLDKNISLEGDMLVKVDRTSMLNSLECRAPFLDFRLMELSYKFPDVFLIKGNNKKRILKDAFSNMLPEGFFDAPKSGFEMPIADWLRTELRVDLLSTLSDENLENHNLFNIKVVKKLMTQHFDKEIDNSRKLWSLYCFQKWYLNNRLLS